MVSADKGGFSGRANGRAAACFSGLASERRKRRSNLFLAWFGAILAAMLGVAARWISTLFLTVFVTLGMGLSVVQANITTGRMMPGKMAAGPGAPDRGDCQACSSGDGAKAMTCLPVCATPAWAAPSTTEAFVKPASFPARHQLLLPGRVSPPDPYPPRLADIG